MISSGSRIAVLKPDHVGDLVLSSPAIRALRARFPDLTLFLNPKNSGLSKYLFPDLPVVPIEFRHLTKESSSAAKPTKIDGFDCLISLRDDEYINSPYLETSAMPHFLTRGYDVADTHETEIQRRLVTTLVGHYSSDDTWPGLTRSFPKNPKRVGISISAGFATNKWPHLYVVQLVRLLSEQGIEVHLIGGPKELPDLKILQHLLHLPSSRAIVGSSDFSQLIDQLSELDLVIAADSGTMHLCSLATPVLALFGPSPFMRYAPFGRHHRTLTLRLSCSPCSQFDRKKMTLCLTRECMAGITPEQVLEAIFADLEDSIGASRPVGSAFLIGGTSHLHLSR